MCHSGICTKPLARQGRPLWYLDRVMDAEAGVYDTVLATEMSKGGTTTR